ncbi:MAG: DMT family transporter [Treponema sp.]|jgi:drug/metabolite transporter (DMT)-like permease|nr:DMT family transporter [Treponema sp.]
MGKRFKGFTLGIIAAAAYGLNPLFALPLYREGMSADSVLFYRYILAALILGLLMKLKKIPFALKRTEIVPLIFVGLLFAFSSLFLFESYNYLNVGIASTILFMYPVIVAIIMVLLFKEKISFLVTLSICLSFAGILMLYRGEDGKTLNAVGVLLVFLSALTYAVYIVSISRSSIGSLPALELSFYAILFGSVVFIVRLKFCMNLQLVNNPINWLNVLALALLPTLISLLAMNLAIQYIGSTIAAVLGALEPVTGLLCGILAFGERLTFRVACGIFMILLAVTLIIVSNPINKWINSRIRKRV